MWISSSCKRKATANALISYQQSLAIADGLAKYDPGNEEWQRDLAVSYGKLAGAFKKNGEPAKALDALRQGQTIISRVTKLSPTNAAWKQDLARSMVRSQSYSDNVFYPVTVLGMPPSAETSVTP